MISRRKFYMLVLLCTSVLLMLTSCMRTGVNINMKEDGSGVVEISYGVAENYYNSMIEQSGTDIFAGKQTGLISEDGKEYICYVEHKPFTSYDELKDILLSLEYDTKTFSGGEIEEDSEEEWPDDSDLTFDFELDMGFEDDEDETDADTDTSEDLHIFKAADAGKRDSFFSDTYYFTATVNPQNMDMDQLAMLNLDASEIFRLVVSVTVPGDITAEGAVVEGNTATFTITDLSEETVITVEGSQVEIVQIILIVVAILLLIGLIIMLVGGKKKPKENKEF